MTTHWEPRQSGATGAIILIGMGALFMMKSLFPGILFVVGFALLIQGLMSGMPLWMLQGALWTIALGVWFATGAKLGVLLIAAGMIMLITMMSRQKSWSKPYVDNTLE